MYLIPLYASVQFGIPWARKVVLISGIEKHKNLILR